jgi:hypothetical protein
MRIAMVLALAVMAGCNKKGDSDTEGGGPVDTDTTPETDTTPSSPPGIDGVAASGGFSGLVSDFGLAEGTNCEDLSGVPYNGATGFFVAEYNWAGGGTDVAGFEAWVLFANDTFTTTGGSDCFIYWAISGTKAAATTDCPSCDFSLALHSTMNKDTSTCDFDGGGGTLEDATSAEEDFLYNVSVDGSGNATFYFPSGNTQGTGAGADVDVGARYASPSSCKFF